MHTQFNHIRFTQAGTFPVMATRVCGLGYTGEENLAWDGREER